ncbi:50S ribosomal protein L32 [bacterium]|nr:50S ribosomal protein L32 [bacterium]
MAVPKKRTGHSAQGSRRANWKATKPETTKCPNCGATVLTHTVCTECGTYKGQPVKLADKAAAVVEEKKPAKKAAAKKTTAKKATKKSEEIKEEAKVEEAVETVEEKTEE